MELVKFRQSSLPILVDTSFLVSVYDKREPYHRQCMAVLDQVDHPLVTCEPVVTEAIYLLRKLSGAPQAILASIQEGQLEIPFQLAGGVDGVLAYYNKYRDTPVRLCRRLPHRHGRPALAPARFSPSTATSCTIVGGGPDGFTCWSRWSKTYALWAREEKPEPLNKAAVRLLCESAGAGMRSETELRRLMRDRVENGERGETIITAVVARLREYGYLDDAAFAETYARLRPAK